MDFCALPRFAKNLSIAEGTDMSHELVSSHEAIVWGGGAVLASGACESNILGFGAVNLRFLNE